MAASQRAAGTQKQNGEGSTANKTSETAKAQSDDTGGASAAAAPIGKGRRVARPATALEWAALALLVFLTYFLMPDPLHAEGEPSLKHVFYYGWLTAISTGFGIVPLIFAPNLASYWVGVSNGKAEICLARSIDVSESRSKLSYWMFFGAATGTRMSVCLRISHPFPFVPCSIKSNQRLRLE